MWCCSLWPNIKKTKHTHTQNVIWISSALFLCLIIDSFFLLIHLYKKYKINIFTSCPDIGDSLLNSCPSSDNPHEFLFIIFFWDIKNNIKNQTKIEQKKWWLMIYSYPTKSSIVPSWRNIIKSHKLISCMFYVILLFNFYVNFSYFVVVPFSSGVLEMYPLSITTNNKNNIFRTFLVEFS